MLNEDIVRLLRPSSKPRKFADSKGLCLLVTTTGSRLWRFRYRFPKGSPFRKENALSFGSYPEVSLSRRANDATPPVRI
jgi:hypothetical protein